MKIFDTAFHKNLRNRKMTIVHHEHVLLMGDLNFRISGFTRAEVLQKINQHRLVELLDQDTLSLARFNYRKDKTKVHIKLKEPPLNRKNTSQAVLEKEARDKMHMELFFDSF